MTSKGAVLTGAVLVVLAGAVFGAGTMSYFSDTAVSTGNVFTAGTLDIYLENDNTGKNIPLFSTDGYMYDGQTYPADGEFYPGSGTITRTLRVHNSLSSSMNARIGGFSAKFYGDAALAQGLMIRTCEYDTINLEEYLLYEGTLYSLKQGVTVTGVLTMIPGGSTDLHISIWMPEDAPDPTSDVNGDGLLDDNDYQGLSMTADISVIAKQT